MTNKVLGSYKEALCTCSGEAHGTGSPERIFMATSAAICFAPFLLFPTTAGKIWSPIFTQ